MHRCLLIQEVLHLICADISTYPCPDLLALALVCRRFFDASMDHFWRSVPDLLPVLWCLPTNIWRVPLTRRSIENAVLTRAIIPADLKRFKTIYAHRVQASQGSLFQIPADVHQALGFAFQSQPIFPNLVELRYDCREGFPYDIGILLGPRICTIELIFGNPGPAKISLLPMLSEKYPALVCFILDTHYNNFPEIGRQMNYVLPGWTQLQVLIVPHLPEESLRVVAGLPHLLKLSLTEVDSEFGDTFSPIPGQPVFPVLRELHITADTSTLCINLLRAAIHCPLEEFTLLCGEFALDWYNTFSALAGLYNKATLKNIHVEDFDSFQESGAPRTTDQLQPLLSLTNLTHIYLRTRYGCDIDNAFLREMATAWPRLQDLDIKAFEIFQPTEQQPRLTLQGLAPLAELCPGLENLAIDIDATHFCFNHINLGSRPSDSWVESLDVHCSPIGQSSVPWVAAYLSGVFPRLRKIEWDRSGCSEVPGEQPDSKRWQEVMNHLAAYRHIHGHQQDGLYCGACNSD
ncbi:hypothetical protein BD779DRAFT_1682338 [Infundibulicybe gibba]|nr:hypothetical protein BD779DRAFT_1682338 [Infundibulicybe gibba]